MSNAFSDRIGVTKEEAIANAVATNSNISTRNIGMAVERERGIVGLPTLVTSQKEDTRYFGKHLPSMYSSYVVEQLFVNAGGYPVNLYQSRVVGAGSAPATKQIVQSDANPTNATSATTQNASASQPQINVLTFLALTAGEQVKVAVTSQAGTANQTFTHSSTITALLTAINAWLVGLSVVDVTAVNNASAGTITITGENDTPYTTAVSNPAVTVTPILTAFAGRAGKKDVGTWGNNLRVRVYPVGNPNGSQDGYFLQVFYEGYIVETFTSNGADFADLLNQVNQRSEYIMLEAVALDEELTTTFDSALAGGVYNAPVESDFMPTYDSVTEEAKGMAVFDSVDVQLLACPEIFSTNFVKQCDDFARTNTKFFVFVMPYLATEDVVEQYYNTLFTSDQSFSAGYLEWSEVSANSAGDKIWIPQHGFILGSGYIKKAGLNNGDVWTPPAGTEATSRGIYRFTHQDLNDAKQSRYVKKWHCNVTKYVPNVGFCPWSSRTYSNNPLFESIHVRLETNWMLANVQVLGYDFIQKIISPSLQKSILSRYHIWYKNLYETGGIEQSVAFEEAVIIEITVNKENRKESELDIYWIPPECLEHLHIRLNRNDGVLVANF